jgi:hypothetical protein
MAAVDGVEVLAGMPPGPRLAAALAEIDPGRVANNDLLGLLAAQSRQAAYEAARQLRVIAEINRANPTFDDDAVDRLAHPHLHAADEVRAALAWSRRAADRECDLAEQVVHELPAVYAAFLAGHIDRPKVCVFAEHLAGLTSEQIARVCARLVPQAAGLTPGELGARLRRMIVAIDPRPLPPPLPQSVARPPRVRLAGRQRHRRAVHPGPHAGTGPGRARADRPAGARCPPGRAPVEPGPNPGGPRRWPARRHPAPPDPRPDHRAPDRAPIGQRRRHRGGRRHPWREHRRPRRGRLRHRRWQRR